MTVTGGSMLSIWKVRSLQKGLQGCRFKEWKLGQFSNTGTHISLQDFSNQAPVPRTLVLPLDPDKGGGASALHSQFWPVSCSTPPYGVCSLHSQGFMDPQSPDHTDRLLVPRTLEFPAPKAPHPLPRSVQAPFLGPPS